MANKYFDPLELAVKLRKAKQTGDTSEIWNYTKTFLDTSSDSSSKESKPKIPSMDPSQLNGYVHDMINQSFKQSLGMFHQMFDSSVSEEEKKQPVKKQAAKPVENQSVKHSDKQAERHLQSYPISKEPEKKPYGSFESDVFETHDYVIVRIKVPHNVNPKGIKVRATPSRLYIKISNYSQEEVILLPTDVDKSDVKAAYADNVLEIIIPKEREDNHQEIHIQF